MKITELNSYNNSWYKPGAKLKRLLWYLVNIIFFKSSVPWPQFIKSQFLLLFGCKVGKGTFIKPNVSIKYPWFLNIGIDVWIGENVWIDNLAKVTIADNVCISQGALILCGNHNYKKSSFDLIIGEINLKQGVWLGAKSVVCSGVTINSHAVLTVGSVAIKDLDGYSIYQGNPAIKIRSRIIT
jgi:putative colanic acid biosynthesis acetyltransferase WcaF